MVEQFKKGKQDEREAIFEMYIRQMRWVNNWDLVDTSAPHIIGAHMLAEEGRSDHSAASRKELLYEWVQSPSLWVRRISMLSTFAFIRANRFEDTLKLAELLLADKEDLIHKAVGWMLR
jgi:3-methyladenine DNA glycosylase AlkD